MTAQTKHRVTETGMTALGQSRRFEHRAVTSDLAWEADIAQCCRHVSKVPDSDINDADALNKKPPEGGFSIQSC
jgi:hypothetical protein